MRIKLEHTVATAVTPSPNVLAVAGMFGLGIDAQRTVAIVPPTVLDLRAHQVVFITGSSGGGKTTLLRLIASAVGETNAGTAVIRFDALPALPDAPLVDALGADGGLSLDDTLRLLSLAGLNDAFVMLRRPSELSDGQRYRLRLAQAMAGVEEAAVAESTDEHTPRAVVLADEFGATLDRQTAAVLARNVRRWADRVPVCFVAATTHDDLLEPLRPDVLIEKRLGSGLEIVTREGANHAEY